MDYASASLLKGFEGWSAAILAVVGVGSLAATAISVFQSRRDAKSARTFEYLRRLYGLEFASLNTRVLIFLRTGDATVLSPGAKTPVPSAKELTPDAKREAYEGLDLEWQAKVALVLNFYEEFSGSYRRGLLDSRVADNMLVPVAVVAWRYSRWLVDHERDRVLRKHRNKQVAEEVGSDWQQLIEATERKESGRGRRGLLGWFRNIGSGFPIFLLLLAGALSIGGLAVLALGGADLRDAAASFLFAAAATCLVLAAIFFAPLLASSPARRALVVSAALTATLSIGITTTVALTSSRGPRGFKGTHGAAGKRGPGGSEGEHGRRGAEGKQGPRGRRGRRGERGPRGRRGPRGYPVYPGS